MPAPESRPASSPSRPSPAFAAAIAGIGLFFLAHVIFLNAVVDDAFITFRYARHVARGLGFVWNVGEPPVEGFTSFLWVVACAVATRLGLDVALAAQVLGTLAGLATLVLTYCFARRRLGLDERLALLPCALLAASGPFATWAGSAMETSLFGFLVLAAAYRFTAPDARPGGVAALLLLATLTRPEGFGIFGLFAIALVLGRWGVRTGRDPDARRELGLAIAYLVPFAAYFAWRFVTFGDWLPNTFHAKTGLSVFIPLRGLLYAGYFFAFYVAAWLPLLLLARRSPRTGPPSPAATDEIRFARVVVAAILLGYVAYLIAVGGDYMAMYRFFVPIVPFVALSIAAGAARLFGDHDAGAAARRPLVRACLVAGFAVTLVHSTPLDVALFGRPRAQQGHYAGVQNERYAVARFAAVGRTFDTIKRSPDDVLATRVVGAIGYEANLRILDMFGITDRHIALAGKGTKPLGLGFPGHERSDLAYVARRRPTWVFLELDDAPRRVMIPDWGTEANGILNREYVVREARISIPGQGEGWLYYLERTSPGGG